MLKERNLFLNLVFLSSEHPAPSSCSLSQLAPPRGLPCLCFLTSTHCFQLQHIFLDLIVTFDLFPLWNSLFPEIPQCALSQVFFLSFSQFQILSFVPILKTGVLESSAGVLPFVLSIAKCVCMYMWRGKFSHPLSWFQIQASNSLVLLWVSELNT